MHAKPWEVKGGALFVGERCVDLPYPVVEVIECKGTLLARLEPPPGVIFNRNVFALTAQGEFLWKIEESPHGTQIDKPYVSIVLGHDESLIAANWNGVDYVVNIQNGKVTTRAFNK